MARSSRKRNDNNIDVIPFIVVFMLALIGVIGLEDPLRIYGLSLSQVPKCPWKATFFVWVIAFFMGRLANFVVLYPTSVIQEVLAKGDINPGGVYLSLASYPKLTGLVLGLPMVYSQTFMEEFIFRGLIVSFGNWFYGLFTMSPSLVSIFSIISSAILFGITHFIPAFRCFRGKNIIIPLYAFVMPMLLGIAFSVLNQTSYSLWPGWIIHFGLNYAGFVWNKASGVWELKNFRKKPKGG